MSIDIVEVADKASIKKFIDFPHDLYADDPSYVPELHVAIKDHIDPKKNPYFKHSQAKFYLAYQSGEIVGRIAATINNKYNAFHQCNVGFFGFFDTINDLEVAQALMHQAELYVKQGHVTHLMGPANLTTNDTSGLLVDGFDSPPVVQMTYNKPYYVDLLAQLGYDKEMDMFAYFIKTTDVNTKSVRLTKLIENRLANKGITLENINMKYFNKIIIEIRDIYQEAWEKNWGFVPPTNEEFDFLAEGLKMVIDPNYVAIARDNGQAIGFVVALPDINEITINIKRGRLLPTGIFKLLLGKKKTKKVRVILLGVKEAYRRMGIEALFYAKMILQAQRDGKEGGEASWILESNQMMNQAATNLNGVKYKTYRIVSKKLI